MAFWLQSTLKQRDVDEISTGTSARKEGEQDHSRKKSDWLEMLCNEFMDQLRILKEANSDLKCLYSGFFFQFNQTT